MPRNNIKLKRIDLSKGFKELPAQLLPGADYLAKIDIEGKIEWFTGQFYYSGSPHAQSPLSPLYKLMFSGCYNNIKVDQQSFNAWHELYLIADTNNKKIK